MVTKADLHRLIDELPEQALPVAERSLAALEAAELAQRVAALSPPARRAVSLFVAELETDAAAPYTPADEAPWDQPEPDELEALAEGRAAPDYGERLSDEELRRELGL